MALQSRSLYRNISLGGATIAFLENSSDIRNLASIARNNTKLNIRYTYYMALHSCPLCTNSSIGGAKMPL